MNEATAALRAVYQQDFGRLVGLAQWIVGSRALAEELVQDTFVHLLDRQDEPDDPAALASYVRSAVVNRSRSRVRRLVLERRHSTIERPPIDDGDNDGDGTIRQAIAELPRRQRECVVLRFYADLTVDGIAETLGISPGSVKTHLHRGLARLSTTLKTAERAGGDHW